MTNFEIDAQCTKINVSIKMFDARCVTFLNQSFIHSIVNVKCPITTFHYTICHQPSCHFTGSSSTFGKFSVLAGNPLVVADSGEQGKHIERGFRGGEKPWNQLNTEDWCNGLDNIPQDTKEPSSRSARSCFEWFL